MKKIFCLFLALILVPAAVFAAGPEKVAKSNRSLWPYPIKTQKDFDFASVHEIEIFLNKIQELRANLSTEEQLEEYVGKKNGNLPSVIKYLEQTEKLMSEKLNKLSETSYYYPDEDLSAWQENANLFYDNYLYEQVRLASLFPKITSEIDVLDSQEIKGDELVDMKFILTFDDGPSPKNGNTDKLIEMLRETNTPAIFFVLGDNFVKRKDVQQLYSGFLVGSHGKTHKPHTKKEFYEESLSFTSKEIRNNFPNQSAYYFRPPYGQRSLDTVKYLEENDWKLMLWNIDSQDWSSKMSASEVKDRVVTLMLLWRSGIILFHDIHPKAREVLPAIFDEFKDTDIKFGNNPLTSPKKPG